MIASVVVLVHFLACIAHGNMVIDESASAEAKMNALWPKIAGDTTPQPWFSPLKLLKLFLESMNVSFDLPGDTLPEDRQKLIHTQGSIAKARFVPVESSPYSGLFESGSEHVLIRFSYAKEPSLNTQTKQWETTPGISVKFLRDGQPSANWMAMYSLDGQQSCEFFQHALSNHVNSPTALPLKVLEKKFRTASDYPTMLGLKNFATYDSQGNVAENIKYPFRLILAPELSVSSFSDDNAQNTCPSPVQVHFKRSSRKIYTMYAEDQPSPDGPIPLAGLKEGDKGKLIPLGYFELTSDAIPSRFGDQALFFRHERMENDFKDRPEWEEIVKSW